MQITCPSCTAQYNVNDSQIPPQGVSIKCPKCQHQFTVKPDEAAGAVPLPGAGAQGPGAVPLPGAGAPAAAGAVPLPGGGAPQAGAVPLPGGGAPQAGAVPLPGGGAPQAGAVPLPGGGAPQAGAVPLPGGGTPHGGSVPLPGAGGGGSVPLPGAGGGSVPLPGAGGGGSVPLPGAGGGGSVPLPGAGGGGSVPLPGAGGGGGSVPLPGAGGGGGSVPLPGAGGGDSPSMGDIFGGGGDAGGGGGAAAPSMGDIFGGGGGGSNAGVGNAPGHAAAMTDIFGDADTGGGSAESVPPTPFHGNNSVLMPGGGGDGGLLDFIDDTAQPSAAPQALYRIRKRSGRVIGPYDEPTILEMFARQELVGSEEASTDGVTWKPLAQIPAFAETIQKAMAQALSGLDLDGVDLPGLKDAPLPGLKDAPLPGLRGSTDLPGLTGTTDLPGLKGQNQGLMGPDGQPLSTGQLLEAERARERATARVKSRGGGGQRMLTAFLLLLFVGGGGAAVAANYLTEHGWGCYKLWGHHIGLVEKKVEVVEIKQPDEAPPPIELPADLIPVDELLARDTYKAYRLGAEQQMGIVEKGKAREKMPPAAQKAAADAARFYALLIHLEDMPLFHSQLEAALPDAAGDDVAKTIGEVALKYLNGKVDDGLKQLAPLADPARGLKPDDLNQVQMWEAIGHLKKADSKLAMKTLDQALQAKPNQLATIYLQARTLVKLGEPAAAEGYLQKIFDANADHPRANLLRGELLIAEVKKRKLGEKLLNKIATGEKASDAAPAQRAAAYMGIARLALGDRRWDEALNNMNAAVNLVPSNIAIRVEHGRLSLQLREFTVARKSFAKLLEANPGNEDALVGLAQSKIGARDALGAYSDLEEALKKDPKNARLTYWFGIAAKDLLKMDVARKKFAEAYALDKSLPGPHVQIIQDLIDRGMLKEALDRAAQAQDEVKPGDRNFIRVSKANIFMRQRSYSLAKRELESAIKENPNNIDARVLYVDLLLLQNQVKKSRDQAEDALVLDPRNPRVIAASAAVRSAEGQHEKAIELLEEATSLSPNDYTLYLRAGAAAIALGDLAAAKGFIDTAGQLQPDNPEVLNLRGQVMRSTDPKQAARIFVQAIEMSPEDPRLRYQLGITYFGMAANLEAIDRFQEAIKLDPGFADAYFRLGKSFKELGRNQEAMEQFKECAKLNSGRADAWVEIAGIQSTLGQSDESIRSFERAIKADPDNPEPICKMGITLVERLGNQKKMLARGRERLQECVQLAPRHETAWRKLGDAMKDARKNPRAVKAYKQHLKVNPDTDDRDYVCDMLKDLGSSCS